MIDWGLGFKKIDLYNGSIARVPPEGPLNEARELKNV
jgi:hypothetical protein